MLDILGIGLVLPPARKVHDLVREAGGDPATYHGWEHTCVAGDEHPSELASAALAMALQEAKIGADQLSLVVAVGVSRDYLPSWSIATEVMRLHGAPKT